MLLRDKTYLKTSDSYNDMGPDKMKSAVNEKERIYRIYPAIRRVFCPSRLISNN